MFSYREHGVRRSLLYTGPGRDDDTTWEQRTGGVEGPVIAALRPLNLNLVRGKVCGHALAWDDCGSTDGAQGVVPTLAGKGIGILCMPQLFQHTSAMYTICKTEDISRCKTQWLSRLLPDSRLQVPGMPCMFHIWQVSRIGNA